jgi:hypothetical protein
MVPPCTPQLGPIRTRAGAIESPGPYLHPVRTPERPYTAASLEESPYPGLTTLQKKKVQVSFKKIDEKVNFAVDILAMAGVELDKEEVVGMISRWADQLPETKTFSKLTVEDYHKLCTSIYSFVNVNDEYLTHHIPDSIIPPEFLRILQITREVTIRSTEMGTRNVINLFLNVAVYVARIVFHEERLVIAHELDTDPIDVPEIGRVNGPLDYVTARARGTKTMSKPPKY